MARPAIDVRVAGSAEFDVALDLLQQFFAAEGFATLGPPMGDVLADMLAAPEACVLLAWREGEPIGVATVSTDVNLEYGRSAEINDLFVLPAVRRSGAAAALVEAAAGWAARRGCSAVLVTVTPEGDTRYGLSEFYVRRGFADEGRKIMERRL